MAKNIIIFSDGTGQGGVLLPDENRSNVYKLFRAPRVCPDTTIDPTEQVAFYDVGLGSKAAGSNIKIGWWHRIYNILGSATGLGLTQNIIDCYASMRLSLSDDPALEAALGSRRKELGITIQAEPALSLSQELERSLTPECGPSLGLSLGF